MKQKTAAARLILLILTLYAPISAVLFALFPKAFNYLMPLTNLHVFFSNWIDSALIFPLVLLLPLLGWLLLFYGKRIGRGIILYFHATNLILQVTVLMVHYGTMLKLREIDALGVEALRALIGVVYSIVALVCLLKWHPSKNIR